MWHFSDIVYFLVSMVRKVFIDYCCSSVVNWVICVATFSKVIFRLNIPNLDCFLLKIKADLSTRRKKFLVLVLNSTTHRVCIFFFFLEWFTGYLHKVELAICFCSLLFDSFELRLTAKRRLYFFTLFVQWNLHALLLIPLLTSEWKVIQTHHTILISFLRWMITIPEIKTSDTQLTLSKISCLRNIFLAKIYF